LGGEAWFDQTADHPLRKTKRNLVERFKLISIAYTNFSMSTSNASESNKSAHASFGSSAMDFPKA
jgi:hypothetical protein